MAKSVTYTKEFFDREYTAREAYGRLWAHARKYRSRIYLGILCGMLTAGTLLPLFQVIQPALDKVGTAEVNGQNARSPSGGDALPRVSNGQDARCPSASADAATSKAERKISKE